MNPRSGPSTVLRNPSTDNRASGPLPLMPPLLDTIGRGAAKLQLGGTLCCCNSSSGGSRIAAPSHLLRELGTDAAGVPRRNRPRHRRARNLEAVRTVRRLRTHGAGGCLARRNCPSQAEAVEGNGEAAASALARRRPPCKSHGGERVQRGVARNRLWHLCPWRAAAEIHALGMARPAHVRERRWRHPLPAAAPDPLHRAAATTPRT